MPLHAPLPPQARCYDWGLYFLVNLFLADRAPWGTVAGSDNTRSTLMFDTKIGDIPGDRSSVAVLALLKTSMGDFVVI